MAYETLRFIWWLLLVALLSGFAITDGFDLGLGVLFRYLGRTDAERRALLGTIEPVWEGNQVWLVLGAGAAFAAWPLLYAASFSNLYPAMFLVLLALILRPVGFTFRDKLADARWREVWDWGLFVSGALPSLLFGVAVGNLFLGVDFHYDEMMRPFFTGSFFGLLHPFALLTGLVSVSMLLMHGATYAALKAGEPMAARARRAGQISAVTYILLFAAAGFWVSSSLVGQQLVGPIDTGGPSNPLLKHVVLAPGAWLANYHRFSMLWLIPAVAIAGAMCTWLLLKIGRAGLAFVSSAATQAGTILTAGCALFPFLLPSASNPDQGLTVWDASSSARTLLIMLVVAIIFLPIILAYTTWVFRVLKGRVTLEDVADHDQSY